MLSGITWFEYERKTQWILDLVVKWRHRANGVFIRCLTNWLTVCLSVCLIGWLADKQKDRKTDWLTGWMTCWVSVWLIECVWESLRSTSRRQRQCHKFCIFNEPKQKLCTPFTCLFHFCTFLSRFRQICDVKWSFLKFYREREHTAANLNFLPWLLHWTSKFSSWVVLPAFKS